jgi:hypothetical protein
MSEKAKPGGRRSARRLVAENSGLGFIRPNNYRQEIVECV